jgi:hypothetical protein
MVELVLTCHRKLTSKCGPLKEQSTSRDKVRPDKLPKEKSQSVSLNDLRCYLNHSYFFCIFCTKPKALCDFDVQSVNRDIMAFW